MLVFPKENNSQTDFSWIKRVMSCSVRKIAAMTLGKIGDKRAMDPLTKALKDEDGYVRNTAAKVLEEMNSL